MMKNKKSLPLLVYFILSLFFTEFILRLNVVGNASQIFKLSLNPNLFLQMKEALR